MKEQKIKTLLLSNKIIKSKIKIKARNLRKKNKTEA